MDQDFKKLTQAADRAISLSIGLMNDEKEPFFPGGLIAASLLFAGAFAALSCAAIKVSQSWIDTHGAPKT